MYYKVCRGEMERERERGEILDRMHVYLHGADRVASFFFTQYTKMGIF
jgi:hypothetical protein